MSAKHLSIGDFVAGRVASVSGTGVRVQLGARLYGRVPLTALHDSWRDNALEGMVAGCAPGYAPHAFFVEVVAWCGNKLPHIGGTLDGKTANILISNSVQSTLFSYSADVLQGSRSGAASAPRSWAMLAMARCFSAPGRRTVVS